MGLAINGQISVVIRISVNSLPLPVAINYDRLTPSHVLCHGPACASADDRAFGVAGPRLWNALPISIRQPHPWTVLMGAKNVFI